MDEKIKQGEEFSIGLILTVEKLCKDMITFDTRRKEIYEYAQKQCQVWNHWWKQERIFVLGITANREDEKDKEIGLLTPNEYEQKFIK